MASLTVATRVFALSVLISTPVAAQDANPQNQLVEGFLACFSGGGIPDLTASMLDVFMWSREEAPDEGLIYYYPAVGEDTFAYMADDGSFCHVESVTVNSEATSQILAISLGGAEGAPFDYSKDEMGCTQLDFETGVTAVITSGGNDPTCGSDIDSAVRFTFDEM